MINKIFFNVHFIEHSLQDNKVLNENILIIILNDESEQVLLN